MTTISTRLASGCGSPFWGAAPPRARIVETTAVVIDSRRSLFGGVAASSGGRGARNIPGCPAPELVETARKYSPSRVAQGIEVVAEVVDRHQRGGGDLSRQVQVPQVRAAGRPTGGAAAAGIGRQRVAAMAGV